MRRTITRARRKPPSHRKRTTGQSAFAATTERVATVVGRAVGRVERMVHRATQQLTRVARRGRTAVRKRVTKRAR